MLRNARDEGCDLNTATSISSSLSSDDSFVSACSELRDVSEDGLTANALRSVPSGAQVRSVTNASDTSQAEQRSDADSPIGRACFEGDWLRLREVLKGQGAACLEAEDVHGLTPLHVAAMRGHAECINLLIDAGAPLRAKSSNGWRALEEAICYEHLPAVRTLLKHYRVEMRRQRDEKGAQLHAVLSGMPDCAFQLKWELSSPVVGLLLHKFLPHDTYTVWKLGTRIRIDGALKGLDEDAHSMLPSWKYGHFSILVDAGKHTPTAVLVDHDKGTYTPIEMAEAEGDDAGMPDSSSSAEQLLLSEDSVRRSRIKFCNFKLQPVKGWLTSELKEDIDGISTTVYEAQGELVANTVIKQRLAIAAKEGATYDDYLRAPPLGNIVAEVPLNFSNGFNANAADADAAAAQAAQNASASSAAKSASTLSAHKASSSSAPNLSSDYNGRGGSPTTSECGIWTDTTMQQGGAGSEVPDVGPGYGAVTVQAPGVGLKVKGGKGRGRKVKARLWMGHDFPLNQKQLLPLLDIMGTTNKHLKKVATFMRKFGDLDQFPVKLQVPLVLSVRIAVRVKHLCVWGAPRPRKASKHVPANLRERPPAAFFEVPQGYTLKHVTEILEASVKKAEARRLEARANESVSGHLPSGERASSSPPPSEQSTPRLLE